MTRTLQVSITGSSSADLPIPENPPEGITVTEAKRRMGFLGGRDYSLPCNTAFRCCLQCCFRDTRQLALRHLLQGGPPPKQ